MEMFSMLFYIVLLNKTFRSFLMLSFLTSYYSYKVIARLELEVHRHIVTEWM